MFGCDLRLPWSLSDDNFNISGNSSAVYGDEALAQARQIRLEARKAMVEMDDDSKVRRALEHGSRVMRSEELQVGDFICYWRRYVTDGRPGMWRGPARVIGFYDGRSKVWVSVGNKVLRCAPEQLRKLTRLGSSIEMCDHKHGRYNKGTPSQTSVRRNIPNMTSPPMPDELGQTVMCTPSNDEDVLPSTRGGETRHDAAEETMPSDSGEHVQNSQNLQKVLQK